MKVVWMDNKVDKKAAIYGLYMRKSLWEKKLVCYFMDRREAIATARHMGLGFSVFVVPPSRI
jgi:hypothetical protein